MNYFQNKNSALAILMAMAFAPVSVHADTQSLTQNTAISSTASLSTASSLDSSALTSKQYTVGFFEVFNQAVNISHDYKALQHELSSSEILQGKEEHYFYPNASLSTEMKEYYGNPRPDPDGTGKAVLTLRSKLWGSSVGDRIQASEFNRLSGEMNLKSKELEIYYVVLKYLTKVELTRQFKKQSDQIRIELDDFYQKQLNATKEGVSTQSDAMEVELTRSKFEEQVFAVVSNIDKYFRDLRVETGLELGTKDQTKHIGVNYDSLIDALELAVTDFDTNKLVQDNYALRSTEYLLHASLKSVNAQRERFKVDLVNESRVGLYGGAEPFEFGDSDDSYVGLTVTYDLFNPNASADQDAAMQLYKAQKQRYDMDIQRFAAQLDARALDYENALAKRNNLIEQLRINRELIENQKNEIYTDKVSYLDIAESISSLNQSEISLLNMELSLYDQLYELMELKSSKIY